MNLNREINSGHYGIEQIAKKYCGLKKSKHIIGIWQHGVFLPEILHYPDQLTSHEIPLLIRKRYPFFVANQHNKDFYTLNLTLLDKNTGMRLTSAEGTSRLMSVL
jgi:hypothetical protein